jgi:hypothetical protein
MSDLLQSTLRSPRWQALQRSLAESIAAANIHADVIANAIANAKAPSSAGGSWLERVRCPVLKPAPHCGMGTTPIT